MARAPSAVFTLTQRFRTQWSDALRLVPLISIPFLILWQASLYLDSVFSYNRRVTATREATRRANDLFNEALRDYVADLKIISSGENLQRLASGDASAKSAVAKDFSIFASARQQLANIRYIDRSGNEAVRVNREGDTAQIIQSHDLQYKGDRYFFRDSIGLRPNELYISPIDLSVEHGQIVTPLVPILRLATVTAGKNGEPSGLVMVSVDVAGLIENIEAERPVNSSTVELLDANGYWLAGAPRENLWGFMFGRDTTMSKIMPEAWNRIAAKDTGSFDLQRRHYFFQTAHPDLSAFSDSGKADDQTVTPVWKLVGIIPAVSLSDIWQRENILPAYIGLVAVILISIGWSNETVKRRNAEQLRKEAEIELIQKQRLAGLGSLVAGVAHELGTPIGNAVTIATTLSEKSSSFRQEVESGQLRRSVVSAFLSDLSEGIEIMHRGLSRASTLIRHFKQVAVDQTSERRRTFKLHDLVRDTVASVSPEFRSAIILETQVNSEAQLDTYAGLLEQVLINLITNARIHGFDEGQRGTILLTARDLPHERVEIVVRDTGKGIPEPLQDKIFEPFFTTKLGQGGSGLGLSITFNIVTGMLGGTIHVESEVGKGTAMVVQIPTAAPTQTSTNVARTYYAEQRT